MDEQGPIQPSVTLPHPNSYAVLDTGVLAGEYPFAPEPGEARRKLGAYLDSGIDYFVDLTEDGELDPYEAVLREEAHARGMPVEYVRLPIRDMDVCDRAQMQRILDTLDAARDAGRTAYVHCWGGVGRTGTVVGCYLVRHGWSGEEALRKVAELFATMSSDKVRRHGGISPQTKAQRSVVQNWTETEGANE